ncbi:MAG: right-handed parallel beta-helix repeat-containing protein [Mycobacteriales bacterium]
MRFHKALAALPFALLSTVVALPSGAATTQPHTVNAAVRTTRQLYVSPHGSDSNPGTRTRPFRQVSRAASVATPGTLVHVAPGVYGAVESTNSGTAHYPIRFVSDRRWAARISAPGSTNAWTNTGDYVVIQNFDIANSEYSGIMSTASHGRFFGNHIHHMVPPDCSRGGAGIELQNYSERDNDSIGNVIHDIQAPSSSCGLIHGIYYQGPYGGRILDNVVYRTSGWGIHLWHNANHITIANNTVFQNKQGGMVIGGSLEGNDIAPGVDSGDVVTNNIVVNNGYYGIREMGRVGRNTYANNLLAGNASGGFQLTGGGVPRHTLYRNPQFLRYRPAGGGDYRLRRSSPAINAGTRLGAPRYDALGARRPQGGAVDIGAYEGGH